MNRKAPLYLIFLTAVLCATALLAFQPYSVDWPGRAYKKPAQQYILAALQQDSVSLARLSADQAPVAWALDAARRRPRSLALWAHTTQAFTGERRGDTADVFLYPSSDTCEQAPIVFRFVGSGKAARVLSASSACLDPK